MKRLNRSELKQIKGGMYYSADESFGCVCDPGYKVAHVISNTDGSSPQAAWGDCPATLNQGKKCSAYCASGYENITYRCGY